MSQYEFILGFKALADLIPDIVGEPLQDEQHIYPSGDGLQRTSTGLLVWRKSDSWTAFTDGYRTWLNGPNGLEVRLNTERLPWEHDYQPPAAEYEPKIVAVPIGNANYPYIRCPRGFVLHGTRSGIDRSVDDEWKGTVGYAANGTDGVVSWHYTIGNDVVARHLSPRRWGWHARAASGSYIGIELAQGTAAGEVTDAQVRAAVWCIQDSRRVWSSLPLYLPTHAEVEASGETGVRDGKTDVHGVGDPRAEALRARIMARLEEVG